MTTLGVITVLACAEFVVAVHEGKLCVKEPPVHQHPTLVAMVEQSNSYRSQHGLTAQPISPYLTELAQAHANWMANTGRFEHNYDHAYPEIIYWNAGSVESAFNLLVRYLRKCLRGKARCRRGNAGQFQEDQR
jgi:hypothetical protein